MSVKDVLDAIGGGLIYLSSAVWITVGIATVWWYVRATPEERHDVLKDMDKEPW